MIAYLIYHHAQRSIAEKFAEMHKDDKVYYSFAPLGHPIGSDNWIDQVKKDIMASDAVVVLMTPEAKNDDWVLRRIILSQDVQKPIFPVMMTGDYETALPMILIMTQYLDLRGDIHRSEHLLWSFHSLHQSKQLEETKIAHLSLFISYSTTDSHFAANLASDLRSKKLTVWRDKDNITKGSSWDNEIQKALENCTHVLFLATPKSVSSENVLDEIGFALNKSKVVIPLILETCELPLRIHRAQWIDFRENYNIALKALLDHLGMG